MRTNKKNITAKIIQCLSIFIAMSVYAVAESEVVLPNVVAYLISISGSEESPFPLATRVAKDWDEGILSPLITAGYTRTYSSRKDDKGKKFDVLFNEYKTAGYTIVTKQTACVWLAEITQNVRQETHDDMQVFKPLIKSMFNLDAQTLKNIADASFVRTGKISLEKNESGKLLDIITFKSEVKGEKGWWNVMQMSRSRDKYIIWALKLTGKPMAAIVGYDDASNENWFNRFSGKKKNGR